MASSKRERELARMRAERQAARRAAAEARRKQRQRVLLVAGAGIAVLALVGGVLLATSGDDKTSTLATEPTASASSGAAGGVSCTYKPSGTASKKVDGLPPATAVPTTVQTALVRTNRGTLGLQLDGKNAPCTVNSFTYLTAQKYFDGTTCHRLVTSGIFVLQCGDPTATGTGGPGYTYDDEALEGATYPAGTLAMANSGPGTNGSQFFMVYKDTQLPPSYTPFGKITSGLDVLLKVAAGGDDGSISAGGGKPKLPVSITSVTLAS